MFKNYFKWFAAAFAACSILFACTPEQSSLTIDTFSQEATIVGKVTYDAGILWKSGVIDAYNNYVPAPGVDVIARIPYSQIGSSSAKGDYTITAKTDANGKFSIVIPVGVNSLSATVSCLPFFAKKSVLDGDGKEAFVDQALYNNSSSVSVTTIKSGEIRTANLTVTSSAVFGD